MLGPALFTIFINDLCNILEFGSLESYVDDSIIFLLAMHEVVQKINRRIKSFLPYKDRLIVLKDPESFIKLVAGIAMTFTWAELSDDSIIERVNTSRP